MEKDGSVASGPIQQKEANPITLTAEEENLNLYLEQMRLRSTTKFVDDEEALWLLQNFEALKCKIPVRNVFAISTNPKEHVPLFFYDKHLGKPLILAEKNLRFRLQFGGARSGTIKKTDENTAVLVRFASKDPLKCIVAHMFTLLQVDPVGTIGDKKDNSKKYTELKQPVLVQVLLHDANAVIQPKSKKRKLDQVHTSNSSSLAVPPSKLPNLSSSSTGPSSSLPPRLLPHPPPSSLHPPPLHHPPSASSPSAQPQLQPQPPFSSSTSSTLVRTSTHPSSHPEEQQQHSQPQYHHHHQQPLSQYQQPQPHQQQPQSQQQSQNQQQQSQQQNTSTNSFSTQSSSISNQSLEFFNFSDSLDGRPDWKFQISYHNFNIELRPNHGAPYSEVGIKIKGKNFTPNTRVYWGGALIASVFVNDTELWCFSPEGQPGQNVEVLVKDLSISEVSMFTFDQAPSDPTKSPPSRRSCWADLMTTRQTSSPSNSLFQPSSTELMDSILKLLSQSSENVKQSQIITELKKTFRDLAKVDVQNALMSLQERGDIIKKGARYRLSRINVSSISPSSESIEDTVLTPSFLQFPSTPSFQISQVLTPQDSPLSPGMVITSYLPRSAPPPFIERRKEENTINALVEMQHKDSHLSSDS